jgi:hypothetical protein
VHDPSGKGDANGALVIGKRLEVSEAEARMIVQIFEWYGDGMPVPQIIDRLTAERIGSPRGTRWTIQTTI